MMHYFFSSLFLTVSTCCLSAYQPIENIVTIPKHPLVVVLMVKNEEDFMEKTLEPFLQAGVQGYLILDTGSTDETIARTKQLFVDYNIEQGYIVEQPFVDFSTSRNYAMECAEQLFPDAGYFFMIDAEWYVQNVDELIQFCIAHYDDAVDSLSILVRHNSNEYYVRRILKASQKIRFTSVVHEYAVVQSYIKVPAHIYAAWNDSQKGADKSSVRFKKDIELLLKQYENNPDDLRTVYYIAQTYVDLQDFDNAIIWFKKRLDAGGWIEERILACSWLAKLYAFLNNRPMALYYYLETFNLNPTRAESLIRIADNYLQNHNYQTAFFFAKWACTLPYPQDAVTVQRHDYLYTRYDILSIAAWHLHEYEIGEQALLKALENFPDNHHLLHNLKIYQSRQK